MSSILTICTSPDALSALDEFTERGSSLEAASTPAEGLEMLRRKRCDFLFFDLSILMNASPGESFREVLRPFWEVSPTVEVVVMTPPEAVREAVKAVRAGARTYVSYPLQQEELKHAVDSVCESVLLQSELDYLRTRAWDEDVFTMAQTKSPAMKQVYSKIRCVAPTRSTVLLTGETGTGKNVLARMIHRHSNRKDAQFISIHCGAIPETLLESELFGHEKGAFTGAIRRKPGKFEIAQGGTIFLDEIGTITPMAQVKLLQVLQDGTFQRIGGEEPLRADVRIISATNLSLKEMSEDGRFRRDLYYRLNVFPVELPPLRERLEDLALLCECFLDRMNKLFVKEIRGIHPDVLDAFESYGWPGNIRELENLLERACILETSAVLMPESFPNELFQVLKGVANPLMRKEFPTLAQARSRSVADSERRYLEEVLTRCLGRINLSAAASGISTRQFHKLVKKYGLRKEDFKPAA
ncbi:MAG TPA: sigma-54-dependent Fis family transcriptional regulator [Desulfobacteraceae bacterium]|nr:sigma-54-dependent Fis family transcriptional regulator [Desulfobacteraceae bacterium]